MPNDFLLGTVTGIGACIFAHLFVTFFRKVDVIEVARSDETPIGSRPIPFLKKSKRVKPVVRDDEEAWKIENGAIQNRHQSDPKA